MFSNRTGGPVEAQNVVNRHFKPLLVRAGLPPPASTTSGKLASRFWPKGASPSATCKPSPATQRRLSPYRGTLTTTTRPRGARRML